MIGTLRKHSKWLWIIIIAVTIISFVVFFSPNSKMSDGYETGNYGSINGHRVTRDEYASAQGEIYLRYFFTTGDWPDGKARLSDAELQRETYFRLFLIRKLEDAGIHASSDAVAKVAGDILRSFNRGNPVPLDGFVKQVLNQRGMTAEDFARFIRHDLGIQQLASIMGLGGKLVTPQEASALYEREHGEISAQAVFFSASNHLSEIAVTPEAVAQFYTNQMSAYRLPDRVQVAYVLIPASNFIADAEQELTQTSNLTELIEATYKQMGGTNFYRDAKSPEEAKQTIRDQEVKRLALVSARKKAGEFANELFTVEPVSAGNLGKLASQKDLSAQLSEPFDRQFPPDNLKVRSDFVKQAFALTTEEPFAGPVVGEDGVYVIALQKKLPSEIPSLDQILQRVTGDYKFTRARAAARQSGASFAAMLAAGIPNGKSFSNISAEAKVHPVLLPPFSMSTRTLPQVEQHAVLSQFKQAAFSVTFGKASEFVSTDEGGFIVFVQSKLPIDQVKMQADLPQFINSVRRTRESEAFNNWFRKEAERGLRDTRAFQQQPTAANTPEQ